MKTILGDRLSARLLQTQTTQALIRCVALNKMTHLGMPELPSCLSASLQSVAPRLFFDSRTKAVTFCKFG